MSHRKTQFNAAGRAWNCFIVQKLQFSREIKNEEESLDPVRIKLTYDCRTQFFQDSILIRNAAVTAAIREPLWFSRTAAGELWTDGLQGLAVSKARAENISLPFITFCLRL